MGQLLWCCGVRSVFRTPWLAARKGSACDSLSLSLSLSLQTVLRREL